ncbi:MAG: PAS domain S-box protein [Deltaproteobacteria bacterium]|nr:MAG: PAS domain S-box protein [Deltaproteobacteria bacterium]
MSPVGPAIAGVVLSLAAAAVLSVFAGPAAGALGSIGVFYAGRLGRMAAVGTALVFCVVTGLMAALQPELASAAVAAWLVLLGTAILLPAGPDKPAPRAAVDDSALDGATVDLPLPEMAAEDVLDALPDWMIEVDARGKILRANRPAGDLFPVVRDSDKGKQVVELFEPTLRKVISDNLKRTANTGRPSSFEYYLRVGDGLHFAEMRILPGRGSLWLISRDVTAKRGREEALRESKERFALAAQGANDGLWDWNMQSDEVYYSHTFKSLLGVEKGFGTSMEAWLSRVHPDDERRVREDLRAHLEGQAPRYESEHRIRDEDGDWIWVLTRGLAVRDKTGKALRIAGSMTDLTHRRVVAATAEKSRLLEHATRAVGIGIAMRTRKHTLVDPSPMLVEMVGAWQSVDHWWDSLQDTLELPASVDCPSCSARQIVGSTRVQVTDPNQMPRVFELTFTGHGHEVQHDQLVNVLLIEDVTDTALAEERLHRLNAELTVARDEALASSRAKSAFLANMSHELRTPLNAILGYSEMLLEDAVDEGTEAVTDLERIHGAGAHLLGLIAGILDLSKVEAGIMQVELADLDLDGLITEVQVTAEPLRRENSFVLDVDNAGRMRTDAVKLRQVLLNLINNAFKFTDGGTVTLEVRGDLTHVTFRVRDTGIGIEDDQKERLFEEFVQGDLSSTKAFQGAGLGLAIVRRFVQLLGGEVSVDSVPGTGSTFQVVLPRDPDVDPDTETLEVDVRALEALGESESNGDAAGV